MRPKRKLACGWWACASGKRDGESHPVAVILTTATAVFSGLAGLILHWGDDGNGGGAAPSAWRATADRFYVSEAARRVVDLAEGWRFATGDDPRWSAPEFDDRDWRSIEINDTWEDQGVGEYDGFGWYRCHFDLTSDLPTAALFLRLGRIDDADEVWVNGRRVGGTGEMGGAGLGSAWDTPRRYPLASDLLRPGDENVIAVRVWDGQSGGGLVDGEPAIVAQDLPAPLLDLTGRWRLSQGDDPAYRNDAVDTIGFDPVVVPGPWDRQGRESFDGDLWYRVTFTTPASRLPADERLVMVLGVIDDEDEAYLNGTLIGSTKRSDPDDEVWRRERAYPFPASLLRDGVDANVLAVRVHDDRSQGGIVRGPVGLMSAEDWERFRQGRDQATHSWSRLWNWLLGRS